MLFPSCQSELDNIREFRHAILQAHESPYSITNETLFELYRKLPGYRVPYLDLKTMDLFIGRLMTVPLRNQVSMLRYLTLIEDMKSAGVPIMRNEWNQAAAFVARSFKYTTSAELRAALELWQESERDYGVRADITTFNILLDGASKSKSVSLATTILKEMRARNLEYDRFTYTTLMMYHANFGDAAKIRQTYQDMVDAGEVVDTVVLNALMTALLTVSEERSAANIYAYMKRVALITTKRPTPMMVQWRRKRLLAQRLKRRGIQWGKNYVEELNVQLGPDFASFHLWIHLYCRTGDWERVQFHMRDMEMFGSPIVRDVYLSMLKGFAWHGSPLDDTPWNIQRLRWVLDKVLDERSKLVGEWDRVMAVWIVRAVEKVYHDEQVLAGVWDEIVRQWARQGGLIPDFALGVYLSSMRAIAQDNEQRRQQQQPSRLPTPPETTDYLDAL
ncbi:hypothetical protein BDD12DRAFT_751342 [Trichophaea hybrida]|nr:hypothetical protein BDD12DRAFT_751342 [Trichophaea hybrida]